MALRSLLLIPLLIALALPATAHAQAAPPPRVPGLTLQAGLGIGGAGAGPRTEAGGHLSGRAALEIRADRTVFTVRTTATSGGPSDYSRFALIGPGTIRDGFHDAGLLVGYALPLGGRTEVVGSAGAAVVWGTRAAYNGCFSFCFSNGESEPFAPRFGVPFELSVSTQVSEVARLGLIGYANANPEEAFGGMLLTVSYTLRSGGRPDAHD